MKPIGTRFHRNVEVPAGRLPEFGGVVARLDSHFLHCVHTGLRKRVDLPPDAVGRILAFDANRLAVAR